MEASSTRVIIGDKAAVCFLEIAKDQKPPEVGKEVRLSKPIKLDNDHVCVKKYEKYGHEFYPREHSKREACLFEAEIANWTN